MDKAKIFVFSDLDDTLIQTEGKLIDGVAFEIGAYDRDGNPLSYFSNHQKTLLAVFEQAMATIIPVTGRTREALGRVNYSFNSFSAVSHGAVVLKPDATICEHWLESINRENKDWPLILNRVNDQVSQHIRINNFDARTRVIIDQGIHAYVSVKGAISTLNALEPILSRTPLRLHRNGRNLALLPPYTCKKRAVEHIKNSLDIGADDLILGMGDSMTDLPFMRSCQFGVIPVHSQIDRELSCE